MSFSEIALHVQGSAEQPYTLAFRMEDGVFSASCTCAAGAMGQACKHRLSILSGDSSATIGDCSKEVETILSWLPGTSVERAIQAVEAAERQVKLAKAAEAKAKKALGATLQGRPVAVDEANSAAP